MALVVALVCLALTGSYEHFVCQHHCFELREQAACGVRRPFPLAQPPSSSCFFSPGRLTRRLPEGERGHRLDCCVEAWAEKGKQHVDDCIRLQSCCGALPSAGAADCAACCSRAARGIGRRERPEGLGRRRRRCGKLLARGVSKRVARGASSDAGQPLELIGAGFMEKAQI